MRSGRPVTRYSFRLLLADLAKLSNDPKEQAEILNQSAKNGWIGVYKLGTKAKDKGNAGNKFLNFEQRNTDYDAMVEAETKRMLLENVAGG